MNQPGRFIAIALPSLLAGSAWLALPSQQALADEGALEPLAVDQISAYDRAVEQILLASRSDDPFIRANAIEAVQAAPDRALPLVQIGMEDPNPAVRFASLVTIGQLKLTSLGLAATNMISDPDPTVAAAAIYAASMCGQEPNPSQLAGMLFSRNPQQRGNAAMLLGMMGDRSAVPMLRDASRSPMPRAASNEKAIVEIQIAEALVKLGEDDALGLLRTRAYSADPTVKVFAVTVLGNLEDRAMSGNFVQMLRNTTDHPVELRVAAANALAKLADEQGLDVLQEAAASTYPTVRSQAVFGLSLLTSKTAETSRVALLDDPEQMVRISAAAAVLRAAQPTRQAQAR